MLEDYSVNFTLFHEIPHNKGIATAKINVGVVKKANSATEALQMSIKLIKDRYNIAINQDCEITHIDIVPSYDRE